MTALAADSFSDMDAVIEVNEIGQVVDARPHDRVTRAVACSYRLQHRTVRPDLRMAVHARLGWRDTGERRGFDRRMAITAVDTERPHVVRVAEGNRLFARHALARGVAAAVEFRERPRQKTEHKDSPVDAQPGKRVGAVMKNLGHGELCPLTVRQKNRLARRQFTGQHPRIDEE